jgi:hypothetical protein
MNQAASGQLPTPPNGIPHLSSPDNLPPGTTEDPSQLPQQGGNLGYLRELWHAVQTQNVSMNDALLALSQRGLDSAPPPGMSLGPQAPPNTPPPAMSPGPQAPPNTPPPAMSPGPQAPPNAPLPAGPQPPTPTPRPTP